MDTNNYIKQYPELMKGKKILYVHGFASSGQSGTVKRLREVFPAAEVVAPDLPLNPLEALTLLQVTCKEIRPDLIIGTSIACGAEAAIIPEEMTEVDQLAQFMGRGIRKSKKSCIVIVSESPKCGALYYAERVKKEFPEFDVRVSILGHLQRGGSPSAHDRILASRTGVGAIEAIKQGQRNVMVGVRNNEVVYVPFSECIRTDKPFNKKLIKVLDELSI